MATSMSPEKKNLHPAPVPEPPSYPGVDPTMLPPELQLRGCSCKAGIYLLWDLIRPPTPTNIDAFELFYYREGNETPHPKIWRSLTDVYRIKFPASFEASNLVPNETYYFIVRAKDCHGRYGPFSKPYCGVWKKA